MQKSNPIHYFFILLFLTIPLFSQAQQTMITKDGKEYKATETWNFTCKDYAYTGIVNVQIAKTEKGGLLKLGVDVSNETFYIGDTVYIILEDGSYITCTDKGVREMKDKTTIAYYFLTAAELVKLNKLTLADVRFRIKGNETTFSSKTGYFKATNKKSGFETLGSTEDSKTYNTKSEIKTLYN